MQNTKPNINNSACACGEEFEKEKVGDEFSTLENDDGLYASSLQWRTCHTLRDLFNRMLRLLYEIYATSVQNIYKTYTTK